MRRKRRILTVKMYEDGIFDRQTKPQKIVNDLLDDISIPYENEYACKYYSIDNYLLEDNLMIEVMGDYFHANPNKFKTINDMQFNDIIRDKSKRTYIKRYYKINMLYLWEHDINNNIKMIEELIRKYIYNGGILDEYNSFNYILKDHKICIRNKKIKPYVDYAAKKLNVILSK